MRVRLRCKSMPGLGSQSRETRGARRHTMVRASWILLQRERWKTLYYIVVVVVVCANDGQGGGGDVGGRKKKKNPISKETRGPL